MAVVLATPRTPTNIVGGSGVGHQAVRLLRPAAWGLIRTRGYKLETIWKCVLTSSSRPMRETASHNEDSSRYLCQRGSYSPCCVFRECRRRGTRYQGRCSHTHRHYDRDGTALHRMFDHMLTVAWANPENDPRLSQDQNEPRKRRPLGLVLTCGQLL